MPEGETLPKSNKSKDWLAHADKLRQKFIDYHTDKTVNIGPRSLGLGFGSRKQILSDKNDSRILSQNEVNARSKGMELLRKEQKASPSSYRKGGKVRKTGLALVHRGETVIPAGKRTTTRKSGRR
jgi:hypothetical protein